MKIIAAVAIAAFIGLAVALVIYLPDLKSDDGSSRSQAREASGAAAVNDDISSNRRSAIVVAAQEVGPAVVSVSVTQARVVRASPYGGFGDQLFDQFFRGFFGEREYVQQVSSLGSGVIISKDGLVVTNEHVVRDATQIKVTLTDGREASGTLVGSEPDYDLALLKIDAKDVPAAKLGDSDDLIIGEWAIAIGNPFGFLLEDPHPSVTVGVISALNRSIKTDEGTVGVYKDMIQTDAAINPGNSGGPLVNSLGEVIGINTFIISNSGGSLGLGFAIPVNRVKHIVDEVAKYGRIRQIWVGLMVQEVNAMIAHSIGLDDVRGVIVTQIDPGSPADKAGIKPYDVIVEVNKQPIKNIESAKKAIFGAEIGDRLQFKMLRQGKEKTVAVVVEEAPAK
ncbi:MAG TPA: trypsin-like peptidase domain-containing protein [bacterium]|nr:trypsin-like peptidase domain-containing protein [bacterium]